MTCHFVSFRSKTYNFNNDMERLSWIDNLEAYVFSFLWLSALGYCPCVSALTIYII